MKKRKDSFFGLHLDLHPKFNDTNLGADLSRSQVAKLLEQVKPDYVTYDCKGHEGYAGYNTLVGFTAPNIAEDSLKLWREETIKRDISMGIHYSGLQDIVYIKNYPECGIQNIDGRTDGKTASVFSDYVDRLIIPQLTEVVEKYDVNGVWLDAECWGAQYDYSPAAILAWTEYCGSEELPDCAEHPLYRKWQQFHREAFHNYMIKWTDEMQKRFPQLDCCSNWAYTTMMPVTPKANIAMISGDFDPFLSLDRARTECRYLENTNCPWELQTWGFDLVEGQGCCQKAPEQIMQEAATVLMHGGAYMNYFLPTRGGYISDRIIETLKQVSAFCFNRKDVSYKSRPMADIAIIYTTKSQLDRSDKIYAWWGNRLDELEGILHLTCESNLSSTVLGECQINNLDSYKAILVPECDSLEENTIKKLTDYANGGGKVVLFGGKVSKLFENQLKADISLPQLKNTTLNDGEDKIQVNGMWAEAVSYEKAELYRYEGKDIIVHSEYMDARENVSPQTAALISKYPATISAAAKKGEFVAFLGDIGSLYFKNHHHYIRRIVKKTICKGLLLSLKVTAPPVIDVSLRKTEAGEAVVHLMNTSCMPVGDSRKFTDYIPPAGNILIDVKCEYVPSKVVIVPENESVKFSCANGRVNFIIDKVHIHSAVLLKR